jgi:hypothetical protein
MAARPAAEALRHATADTQRALAANPQSDPHARRLHLPGALTAP